jgi:hypothetical protein
LERETGRRTARELDATRSNAKDQSKIFIEAKKRAWW